MSELYMMVTITNRKYMPKFAALYRENQIETGTVSLGMGTAASSILDYMGLEDDEKSICFHFVTASTWKKVKKRFTEPAADRRARNRDRIYHSHEQYWRKAGIRISHSGAGVYKRGGKYIERDKA